jgi:hypothetical protein
MCTPRLDACDQQHLYKKSRPRGQDATSLKAVEEGPAKESARASCDSLIVEIGVYLQCTCTRTRKSA